METPGRDSTERAFKHGLLGNGGLALLKLVVGWAAGSRSLVADGWHSLANVVVAGAAWLALRFSRREPDGQAFGQGKLEAFSGLLLGVIFLVAGLGLAASAWTSTASLSTGFAGGLALAVAVASIAVNGVLFWIVRAAARDARALASLAYGNASDALAGALVVSGVLASRFGHSWADPLAAFGIACLVVWMGWRSAREGFVVLMDRADPELRKQVLETVQRVDAVKGVKDADLYPIGRRFAVDLEIEVDARLTMEEAARIARSAEDAVTRGHPSVCEARVHVSPAPTPAGSLR